MKRGEREKGGGRKEEEGENLILFFSAVSTCHREFFSHFLSRPHASTLFPPQPSFSISFSLKPSLFSIILPFYNPQSPDPSCTSPASSSSWQSCVFFPFIVKTFRFRSIEFIHFSIIFPLSPLPLSLPILYVSFFYSVKATQFSCYAISLSLFLDCQSKESTLLARFKVALDSLGDS